jgi:hypothetical protein
MRSEGSEKLRLQGWEPFPRTESFPSTLSLPSILRSSLDTESSFDPEVSGPKGGTKCRTEGQDEPCLRKCRSLICVCIHTNFVGRAPWYEPHGSYLARSLSYTFSQISEVFLDKNKGFKIA